MTQYLEDRKIPSSTKSNRKNRITVESIISNDTRHCVVCNTTDNLHFHHINPEDGKRDCERFYDRRKMYAYYRDHPDEAKQKLQLLCRSCHNVKHTSSLEQQLIKYQNRRDRFWKKNRDRINQQRRERYQSDISYHKKRLEAGKKFADEHKERIKKYQKQYREKHKEQTKEYKKLYWKKNKALLTQQRKERYRNKKLRV